MAGIDERSTALRLDGKTAIVTGAGGGLSRVAAHEWASDGIRVNLVSPIAATAGVEQWAKTHTDQYEQMLAGIPLGRLGDPEHDIAPVVVFLASDASRYMTGQTLMADGGTTMLR